MVKNVNTLYFTEKIRFGRYTSETQPVNSIVINASKQELPDIKNSGFYASPIRYSTNESNVVGYNSTSGEILDMGPLNLETITRFGSISNVHTKFKSLEVENLDVVNFNKININEINDPILELGKSDLENPRDVRILMTKGKESANIDYDGDLSLNSNVILLNGQVKLSNDLFVPGKIYVDSFECEYIESKKDIKAEYLHGDGTNITNLSYKQLGDTFEDFMYFKKGFEVPWLAGDGSRITGIGLDQIDLNTEKDVTLGKLATKDSVTIDGSLKVYNTVKLCKGLTVNESIKAVSFYGDGTTLDGVAHEVDLNECKNNVLLISEKTKNNQNEIEILKNKIENIFNDNEKIKLLEEIAYDNNEKIKDIESVKAHTPIISEIKMKCKGYENTLKQLTNDIKSFEDMTPWVKPLEKDIKNLKTNIETINENIFLLPQKFKSFDNEIFKINKNFVRKNIFENNIENLELKINNVEQLFSITENQKKSIISIRNELPRIDSLEREIPRFEPLESLVPCIHSTESNVNTIQSLMPPLDLRVTTLENKPLKGDGALISNISLQHVTNYGNEINGSIKISENINTKTLTFNNVPKITSRTGEIKCININNIAEISGFAKSNDNTTAGKPGGIVIKTKRPQGKIENSVLIDGNGKVAIGSDKVHPSAILSLESKTGGLLLPRMTWIEMKNIKNPEPGLMIYEVESDTVYVYKRSGWTAMC